MSAIPWFHSAGTSVSMFTINVDNCLFLCSCSSSRRSVFFGAAVPSPASSPSSCSGVWVHGQWSTNPANLQCCCCSTGAETGFVPTSSQFFVVGTFLILRSPSWTRSCSQKYRVSMCFVHSLAPNRPVKEFAVELSLCVSIFIGIPRSWYIDLRDSST